MEVQGQLRNDVWEDGTPPGAYDFAENDTYIIYRCPCGNGQLRSIPICVGTKVEKAWLWNGSKDKPTLTPSIQVIGDCEWHGFLTDGVWSTV